MTSRWQHNRFLTKLRSAELGPFEPAVTSSCQREGNMQKRPLPKFQGIIGMERNLSFLPHFTLFYSIHHGIFQAFLSISFRAGTSLPEMSMNKHDCVPRREQGECSC